MSLPEFRFHTNERCDLHVHSVHSDGELKPQELLELAKQKNLSVIALTDHHTVAGLEECIYHGKKYGIYVIPGVEINSRSGDFLGLFIDYQNEEFISFLHTLHALDIKRINQILNKVNEHGYSVSYEELSAFSQPAYPRRTHLARLLVQKKYFTNVDQAFDKLLGKYSAAYIPSLAPDADLCIRAIQAAGGIAILAHPYYEFQDYKYDQIKKQLHHYKYMGVIGYEYSSSINTLFSKTQEQIHKIAIDLDFIETHNSNFHGHHISEAELGQEITPGNTIAKLTKQLSDRSLYRSFFKRMYWRSVNLTDQEFRDSLSPKEIKLDDIRYTELFNTKQLTHNTMIQGKGCPFVLIHGDAIYKLEQILALIIQSEFKISRIFEKDNYFEIAWTLYEMSQGTDATRNRNLLKFNLDHALFGQNAKKCIIVFIIPPNHSNFREFKILIRKSIGKIHFYRLNYKGIIDVHFDSFIHMPDENRVDIECGYLRQFGIKIPQIK